MRSITKVRKSIQINIQTNIIKFPSKFNTEQRIQRIPFRVQFEIHSKTVRPDIFLLPLLHRFPKPLFIFLFRDRNCSFVLFEEQRYLVGSGKELVDEVHVGDVVLLISDDAEKFAELGGFVVLELLTERPMAGTLLVEDLQAFNVVLLDSGGGGVGLDGGEDGLEVGEGDSLLAQLGGATGGFDGSVGHVAAQSAEDVAQVESVDIVALVGLVEDDESVLGFGFRHFDSRGFFLQQYANEIQSLKQDS